MADSMKCRPSASFNRSFLDYSCTDDSDNSYTIEDISVVLDSPDVTSTSQTTAKTPNSVRRARIKYGGSSRRHVQTAANDSSIFCEVTPLPLRRKFMDERVSDSIISIDEDISYDDTFLKEKDTAPVIAGNAINTEMFRRFSPRRVAVKLLPTSKKVLKRQSGISKTRPSQKKPYGLLKFLFLGKHGCLNKVLD